MQVSEILGKKPLPQIGEMRLWRGSRSMCLNPRVHYAGGIGPLWAIEGVLLEFSLIGSNRYYRGFCQKVDPKTKTVVIAITQGNTWGSFAQGKSICIGAHRFSRCHLPDPELPSLVNEAQMKEAEVKAKHAFVDLSIEELELGFKGEFAEHMKKLIGEVEYQWFHSAFTEYNKLRIMAAEAGAWYVDHPSKAINKQRNKLIRFMNSAASTMMIKGTSND
jgi:hypothetical protein